MRKQAIDYADDEWQAKRVGFVSYGCCSIGMHAVDQLRTVFTALHAVTVRDASSASTCSAASRRHWARTNCARRPASCSTSSAGRAWRCATAAQRALTSSECARGR
ncbi:NADPH-dependent FMN reductase [Micromonospora sp. DT47]|uniref:NADPH-dependent FMN reductase n=1 Tax=Micromonospora sp. DT47 TaxID=3393431 RepID=UPI003CE6CBE2